MGKYQYVVQKFRAFYQIPQKYKWIGLTIKNGQISYSYFLLNDFKSMCFGATETC